MGSVDSPKEALALGDHDPSCIATAAVAPMGEHTASLKKHVGNLHGLNGVKQKETLFYF